MKTRKEKGFNLIELMIAVGIVGILGSIAMPYFGDNLIAAHRSDGRSALLRVSATMEQCKALYNKYTHNKCSSIFPVESPDELYKVTSTLTDTTYELVATPLSTTTPEDTDCTTITLDNIGVESGTGADPSVCW